MPSSQRPKSKRSQTSRPTEGDSTRLPYLINAAQKLKERQEHVDWTIPIFPEERQEHEQNALGDSKKSFTDVQGKKLKLNRGKKQVSRLPPGLKRSNGTNDTAGGYAPMLPALDERVLILYHSSLQRAWKRQQQQLEPKAPSSSLMQYGHEAIYAATQIQKIFRGVAARNEWRAFYCLRNQHAASQIQFAYRRAVVRRRVLARLAKKRIERATQIQAWYRGHRCRDLLLYQHIRLMSQRIANFQRYIRGRRLWRIVMAILYNRRSYMATEIQRCYRGWNGRRRAVDIRFEQNRHVRELIHESELHARFLRCKGCNLENCTEDSLFACFMVRYVGLHDFKRAKALCEDGLRLFPSSSKFVFFYSVLLQAMCEDVETCMAFLKRAKEIGITDEELTKCETQFFQPAHLLRSNDAQAFLNSAIMCQCRDQLLRAEANYAKALDLSPQEYAVPGYLHRVNMVDRLLLNYHRFCSIFNFRQVNVLLKEVFTAKKGKKVRMMVSKFNHYTAITPMDNRSTCRINTLYLTDEEVLSIIKLPESGGEEDDRGNTWNTSKSILGNSMNPSTKQKSFRPAPKDMPSRMLSNNAALPQLYNQNYIGLNFRPNHLARFSESRSKLRLTKPAAELLLNTLVFVDPVGNHTELVNQGDETQQAECVLEKVMLIPSVLKMRQQLRSTVVNAYAAIDVQRMYRGFRLRADIRRERLLSDIKQQQVDEMYRLLHENYILRELRRSSAIAIQKVYKGYAFRTLLHRWQIEAAEIQRIFRGYRGRLRAAAFREGTCTFYMAQRVYQRGMDISGRRVMLIIEKCGLSFRLDGYDLEASVTYHGFFSHSSTIALLCYLNWTYAETLCGRELTRKGDKIQIRSVSSINRLTGECFVNCVGASTVITIPLAECVQVINLRAMSAGNTDTPVLFPPMTGDDTARLVKVIAERTILVPALRMVTQDIKTKAPADFTISVQPPPQMHFTYQQRSNLGVKRSHFNTSDSSAFQFTYPVIDGLRGLSIGTKHFRKKCTRHAVQLIRCRCILPIVPTSAHIEAISRALVLPAASSHA